ncbi:hypothetical protein PFICI_08764 [Pestalotiopsis fici W106-1]|uniref:Uncharacterized protein n=1 Tax=Pestalotiopsis fici (strain W106-1 / CGMCC3.15140) TaxID=1229662 RepID=W3X172_PESFW|nr:uncharacterized protein PFICI_08764 [Pestalotiopsis fici W106-1]ETS78911.1 hypothetical protein PFICI_08764 [Pestalotiopsis fici W106-1]
MLDVRHANLPKPPTDLNAYTLGSIGDHNIVIACLPKGKYGTVSASVVATNMASTFPAIRFGLMVGIGGGIPPSVRLGDVVVSVPVGQYPGVVQWDSGKAEEGGTFRRTGALNNPPTSLLTVLTKLESEHEMMGPQFPQYLEDLATKYPRLASKYIKSDELQDILFDKDYPHADNGGDGGHDDSCKSCDKSRSVKREPREAQVHYGLVASGNQVIKDAIFRDSLIKELGDNVLCVEMEAAGLMDNFPCIVIRGICDYADSHKNKAWQEHAAAIAAAFTKELLGYVTVAEVAEEVSATEILSQIDQTVETIKEDTTHTKQLLDRKEDRDILSWLSQTHYGAQQSDILRKWHSSTGRWFLNSTVYQDWLETKGRTLFCPGIPGAGKTIMAAAVINNISLQLTRNTKIGLGYVYFTFSQRREQTIEHVLSSLMMQFLHRQDSLPKHVRELYERHKKNGTRPSRDELIKGLQVVASGYERAFIVLDAIDECSTINQCRTQVLDDIAKLQVDIGINILATSRMLEEITSKFGHQSTVLPITAQKADVELVLKSQMEVHDQEIFSDSFKDEVAYKVARIAKGMFLLAQLHLNALIAMPTKGKIKRALEGLSSGLAGLHDVYESAMVRIESQNSERSELAKSVLSWIVHARTPLSVMQLQHALSVTPNAKAIDEDDIPTVGTLQSVCGGLVTIDTASDKIRLIHYTTQEYFERTREKWFPHAQQQITQTCMTYLSFPIHIQDCEDIVDYFERSQLYPLYDYAHFAWMHHAKESPAMPEVVEFLRKVERDQVVLSWDLSWCGQSLGPSNTPTRKTQHAALHMAIHFGLDYAAEELLRSYDILKDHDCDPTAIAHAIKHERVAVVKLLLQVEGMDVNRKDCHLMTPLAWAAQEGQAEIARLLLRDGRVEINSKNGESELTPLALAARGRDEGIVQLLLETKGVDINSKDREGQTPLALAIKRGTTKTIEFLLQAEGIDIKNKDHTGQTPLALALERSNMKALELLLKTEGIDINTKDSDRHTPIGWAIASDFANVVELLINTEGVDVNRKNQDGVTPLVGAIGSGFTNVVELLLKTEGIDVNQRTHAGQTPLALAIERYNTQVVGLLLNMEGVDVNRKNHTAQTPLAISVKLGNKKVTQMLLDTGRVNIGSQDQIGQTPLTLAFKAGDKEVFKMLLEAGAVDINRQDQAGRTLLALPASKECAEMIKMLLESGRANANLENQIRQTVLALAAKNGLEELVEMLLATDKAEVDNKDLAGQTALFFAAENGHEKVVQLLVGTGKVYINRRDGLGQTPLAAAASRGHDKIVEMLLKIDKINIDGKDINGLTPLAAAASRGHDKIVEMLLKIDKINIDGKDNNGLTPLALAAKSGSFETVKLFIETGKADRESRNRAGYALLTHAAREGCMERVEMLLNSGYFDFIVEDMATLKTLRYFRTTREDLGKHLVEFVKMSVWRS